MNLMISAMKHTRRNREYYKLFPDGKVIRVIVKAEECRIFAGYNRLLEAGATDPYELEEITEEQFNTALKEALNLIQ